MVGACMVPHGVVGGRTPVWYPIVWWEWWGPCMKPHYIMGPLQGTPLYGGGLGPLYGSPLYNGGWGPCGCGGGRASVWSPTIWEPPLSLLFTLIIDQLCFCLILTIYHHYIIWFGQRASTSIAKHKKIFYLSRLLIRSQVIFSIWRLSSRPITVTVICGGSGLISGRILNASDLITSLLPWI